MIGRLALRSLTAHPLRSAVLAAGFGFGVAVMAILLGVAAAHAVSAAVSRHAATWVVSGSPSVRSRLGMPPRASTREAVPPRSRYRAPV